MGKKIRVGGPRLPQLAITTELRGVVSLRQTNNGPVAAGWPRKRGQSPLPAQQERNADFTRVVAMVNDAIASDVYGARELARGTGYIYRDVLMRAAVGRWLLIRGINDVTIQTELDSLGYAIGSILIRTPTGWATLEPDIEGHLLTAHGTGQVPTWEPPPATAAGGLFGPVIGAAPTQASTGFSTPVNGGDAYVVETDSGLTFNAPPQAARSWKGLEFAAPTAPYRYTGLLAIAAYPSVQSLCCIGWRSNAGGLHLSTLQRVNQALQWEISRYSSLTNYTGTSIGAQSAMPNPCWLQVENNGTAIIFSMSATGEPNDFMPWYQVALASAPLGASGYNNIVFGCDSIGNQPYRASLLSWRRDL